MFHRLQPTEPMTKESSFNLHEASGPTHKTFEPDWDCQSLKAFTGSFVLPCFGATLLDVAVHRRLELPRAIHSNRIATYLGLAFDRSGALPACRSTQSRTYHPVSVSPFLTSVVQTSTVRRGTCMYIHVWSVTWSYDLQTLLLNTHLSSVRPCSAKTNGDGRRALDVRTTPNMLRRRDSPLGLEGGDVGLDDRDLIADLLFHPRNLEAEPPHF